MDIRHLETFQTIVKEGSFVQAAEKLNYAQSTITLHMQRLEAELGVDLFLRQGKQIQLTEAGRALREQADILMQRSLALQQSMRDVVAGEAGHIRIGAIEPTASLRLTPLLVQFCQQHPKLHLTFEVAGTRAIGQRVATGSLDVGVTATPHSQEGVTFEPLFLEPLTLLLSQNNPLAQKDTLSVSDLLSERILLTEYGCEYRALIERTLLARGVNPVSGIEMGSVEVLKRAVQGGLGLALLPRAATIQPLPRTVARNLQDVDMRLPIGLALVSEIRSPGRALDQLLTLLRTHLRVEIQQP
jgi:LysR family transcriptional regulator, regulator of the ytmI operon